MTQFTTFVTIGNREGDLRDYISTHYGLTPEVAQSIVAAHWPPSDKSREGHYKTVHRMHHAAKWHAAARDASRP